MSAAYPLQWPDGRGRTQSPQRSRFGISDEKSRQELVWELQRLGARYRVISTNVALRQDGYPYANQRQPDDPGVAVYFEKDGRPMCFACDRWDRVRDNMRAICKTIEAIRGIARWGSGDMLRAAFSGFEALPPPDWRGDLGLSPKSTLDDAETAYRRRARSAHPDAGGSADAMARLNSAVSRARQELCP